MPFAIRAVARRCLRDASRADEARRRWASSASSILHRCGEDFYFLLVCTWRNENELWETVWAKNGDERRLLPAVADRGRASTHVLRVGARRRLSRAGGVGALSPVRAGQGRQGRISARLLLGCRLMASVPEGKELFIVRVERGGPWDWSKDMRAQDQWTEHAHFMNSLVDDGLILLGGPLERRPRHVPRRRLAVRGGAPRPLRGGSVGAERDAHDHERRALDDPAVPRRARAADSRTTDHIASTHLGLPR